MSGNSDELKSFQESMQKGEHIFAILIISLSFDFRNLFNIFSILFNFFDLVKAVALKSGGNTTAKFQHDVEKRYDANPVATQKAVEKMENNSANSGRIAKNYQKIHNLKKEITNFCNSYEFDNFRNSYEKK